MITPIRYVGSKVNLSRVIIPMIPPHDCYVEVFGGSGAVLFNKPESKHEIYNDIDNNIVNLFQVLQDNEKTKRLQERLDLTLYARKEHARAVKILHDKSWADDVEHAWAVFVKYNQSVNGIADARRGGWGYGASHDTGSYWSRVFAINEIAQRLYNVQIENCDFRQIFKRYDGPGVFFYLDPPYSMQTREGGRVYTHEITPEDHLTLLLFLEQLQGEAILSGYKGTAYDDLLSLGWSKKEIPVKSHMKIQPGAPDKTEVLWCSKGIIIEPKPEPLTLFPI